MEAELNDFFEKLDKNKLDEENRTKEIKFNIDDIKIDFFKNEKDIKENFEEDEKEDDVVVNSILEDLNKNILINVKEEEEEDKNQMACREILEILRYPLSQKNIRGVISPFKPLLQPRKVSMVGKVFYNSTTENDENKTRDNTTTTCNGPNEGK